MHAETGSTPPGAAAKTPHPSLCVVGTLTRRPGLSSSLVTAQRLSFVHAAQCAPVVHRPLERPHLCRSEACSAPAKSSGATSCGARWAWRRACTGCPPRKPGTAAGSPTTRATSPQRRRARLHRPLHRRPAPQGPLLLVRHPLPPARTPPGRQPDRLLLHRRPHPGLHYDADGGLTLHIRKDRPTEPQHGANWLPAPDGLFTVIVRLYGPDPSVLDGTWTLPDLAAGSERG